MKKLTKLLFAGVLAIAVAPAFAATLSKKEEKVAETKATLNEQEVWSYDAFKTAMLDPDVDVVILKSIDKDSPSSIINMTGNYMEQAYAINYSGNKDLVIDGDVHFKTKKNYTDANQCAGLIRLLPGSYLSVKGSGNLTFYPELNDTIFNSIFLNDGGTLSFKRSFGTIGADVQFATSSKVLIQTRGNTYFYGGNYWGTDAIKGNTDEFASLDIQGGEVGFVGGTFTVSRCNSSLVDMVSVNIGKDADVDFSGGSYRKVRIPEGKTARDYISSELLMPIDNDDHVVEDLMQEFRIDHYPEKFTVQPSNVETKIGKDYPVTYQVTGSPDGVDLYSVDNNGLETLIKVGFNANPIIRGASFNGSVKYFLSARYSDNKGHSYQVRSNTFIVDSAPIYVDFNRGVGSGYISMIPINHVGDQITLPENEFKAPEGKDFYGWSYNNEIYQPGQSFTVTKDVCFKAIFKNKVYKFSQQPVGGVIGLDDDFVISWAGNFTDLKVRVEYYDSGVWKTEDEFNGTAPSNYTIHGDGSAKTITYQVCGYSYNQQTHEYTLRARSNPFKIQWKSGGLDSFTVEFDHGAGSGSVPSQTVTEGDFSLPECTFTGPNDAPVFEGWESSEDSIVYQPGENYQLGNNVTFTATWFEGYNVTLKAGSETVDYAEHAFGDYVLPEYNSNELTPDGYYFDYWEFDDKAYYPGTHYDVSGDVEFEAHYSQITYDVYYSAGGGNGESIKEIVDAITPIFSPQTPVACGFSAPDDNHEFSHWYDVTHGVALDASEPQILQDQLNEDIYLVAVWKLKEYSVTYNAGAAAGITGNNPIEITNITYGNKVKLRGADLFKAPENKHFIGWAINAVDGDKVGGSEEYTVEGNVTFYALWADNFNYEDSGKYTISFNANGGAGTMADLVDQSGSYTLPECAFTAPEGKEFRCWNISGQEYSVGQSISVTTDLILVAVWKNIVAADFTVSFEANGGTGAMNPVQVKEDAQYILPECGFTAPTGKMFDGWMIGLEKKLTNQSITINGNVTLIAQWKDIPAVTYVATFNANGGSGSMNQVSGLNGDYALPLCSFTAPANKEFEGWKVNGQGELKQPGEIIEVNANVELVAQWKDNANPSTPEKPAKKGLSGGAIAGIVIGSVAVASLGGFAVFWFVIKKKTFADLVAIFKKK